MPEPDRSEQLVKLDQKLAGEADRLIQATQAAIERAKETIKKNQDCLDRIKADRMPEPASADRRASGKL